MSATIVQSSGFASRGYGLASASVTESVNGLVDAQLEFVTTPAKRDTVGALFYQDAPPPIYPAAIDQSNLVMSRLFMVERTTRKESGFIYISARYVGAIQRAGFLGYQLSSETESPRTGLAVWPTSALIASGGSITVAGVTTAFAKAVEFQFTSKVVACEFMRVGQVSAALLPQFRLQDLITVTTQRTWGPSRPLGGFVPTVFGLPVTESRSSDTSIFNAPLIGSETTSYANVQVDEQEQYLTPTVKLVRRRHFVG